MNALPLQYCLALLGWPELIGITIIVLPAAFWVWMLVDCANNEPVGSKTAWILIILLASCIGAPIYYFARKLPRDNAAKKASSK